MDELIRKILYIFIYVYIFAYIYFTIYIIQLLKKDEILSYAKMDEPGENYTKWNYPVREGQILHAPSLYEVSKVILVKLRESESRIVLARGWVGRGKWKVAIQWIKMFIRARRVNSRYLLYNIKFIIASTIHLKIHYNGESHVSFLPQ